jgi:hypothetical protein
MVRLFVDGTEIGGKLRSANWAARESVEHGALHRGIRTDHMVVALRSESDPTVVHRPYPRHLQRPTAGG